MSFEVAEVQLVVIVNATRTMDPGTPKNDAAEWVLADLQELAQQYMDADVSLVSREVKLV